MDDITLKGVSPATQKSKKSWAWVELVRTYQATHHRVKMIRAKCNILYGPGKLKQVRKYKDLKTGERIITVELEF